MRMSFVMLQEKTEVKTEKKMMHKLIPKCHILCVTMWGANLPRSALDPPRDRCRSSSAGNLRRDPRGLMRQSRQRVRPPVRPAATPRVPRARPQLELTPRVPRTTQHPATGSIRVVEAARVFRTNRAATSGALRCD